MDVQIGVAAFKSEEKTSTKSQSLTSAKQTLKASLEAAYGGVRVATAADTEHTKTDEQVKTNAKGRIGYNAIGGNVSGGTPEAIAKYRDDPNTWRVINVKRFEPIFSFLPIDLRQKIKK